MSGLIYVLIISSNVRFANAFTPEDTVLEKKPHKLQLVLKLEKVNTKSGKSNSKLYIFLLIFLLPIFSLQNPNSCPHYNKLKKKIINR